MSRTSIRGGIETFLHKREAESPYLIPKWSPDLESQFLVHEGSVAVEDCSNTWTDGEQTWAHHRWPHNAGTNPSYNDQPLKFSPRVHLRRMGSTWWNWKTKRSVAVAFDIDLEGEHAKSTTTVTAEQLKGLIKKLEKLDYLTMVRSSGGGGAHIYCFFDPEDQPMAANHNEHTQVAQALISKISEDLNYNLRQHMDAVGVVFWFWSCDSPEGHPGYELIQEQTRFLRSRDIKKYRDSGLTGPNQKIKVEGYTEDGKRVENNEQGGGYKTYELEPAHKEVLKELEDMGYTYIWSAEYNMAHTHTCAIRELFEKRAEAGNPMKGVFCTISQGTDRTKPNCYMTPRPGGVFQVKRFGTQVSEHPTWQSRDGDTWCFLNQEAPVLQVLKKFATTYDGKKMVFDPDNLEHAMKAFGHSIGDAKSIDAPINVMLQKDGTFKAAFKASGGNYDGWEKTASGFARVLPVTHKRAEFRQSMLEELDSRVRNLVTPENQPYGWALRTEDFWVPYTSYDPVSCIVTQMYGKDAGQARAEMTMNPWILDHTPFGKEYPGGRLWNKNSPQFAIEPADRAGPHPHWDLIMDHLGKSLDATVATMEWCQQWGIHTGADYLRFWIAALFQYPDQPLPYLFFYGPQDSGKSIFHESIALLVTCGIQDIATALTSSGGYNAEIANAILGVVEEKDLSVVKDTAYTRIKDWLLAPTISIHEKGHTPYRIANTLHVVHMANRATACPMEDGDTRITAIMVTYLEESQKIPRIPMMDALNKEAPYFLRTVLTTHLPQSPSRLRLPMLATEHKADLESMNQTPFESFCSETLFPRKGHSVKFVDFYALYQTFCTTKNMEAEKKNHVIQLLRNRGDKYLIGIGRGKQYHIGNMSLDPKVKHKKKALRVNDSGRLTSV